MNWQNRAMGEFIWSSNAIAPVKREFPAQGVVQKN